FKQKKFLIGGIIIIFALGFLGYTSLVGASIYYYTVGELLEQGRSVYGENVRVNGKVAPGSVEKRSAGSALRFDIIDDEGGESLSVVFQGVVPDTFNVDSEVVIEGSLNSGGIFEANILMATCPSKYVPVS
ncbi:MAG: cytochrome c maturation protein CcmE, partial [Dehalococcoidales bacterium]